MKTTRQAFREISFNAGQAGREDQGTDIKKWDSDSRALDKAITMVVNE